MNKIFSAEFAVGALQIAVGVAFAGFVTMGLRAVLNKLGIQNITGG